MFRMIAFSRQQQRAERPREQDERHDRDQRDHQREAAVDGVDEVGVRRAAGRRRCTSGPARVRRVAHARRACPCPRRSRCPGSGSPRRSRCRRGASRRRGRDGAVDPVDLAQRAPPRGSGRWRLRRGSRAAGATRRRSRRPRVPAVRPWRRPTWRRCWRRTRPRFRSVAAHASARNDRQRRAGGDPAPARDAPAPSASRPARLVVGAAVRPVEPRAPDWPARPGAA